MRITVTVKPNAKEARIEKTGEREFTARVKAPPVEGRANEALVELLSEHFGIPKSRIAIARGGASRKKFVDIIL